MTRRLSSLCSEKCAHLLAALLLVQMAIVLPQQANCSSYLGDYFLPTAKLALNKLQQSFGAKPALLAPEVGATQSAQVVADNATSGAPPAPTEAPVAGEQPREEAPERAGAKWEEPPKKSDFVRLETTADLALGNSLLPALARPAAPDEISKAVPAKEPPPPALASTEASDVDPTSAASGATAGDLASGEQTSQSVTVVSAGRSESEPVPVISELPAQAEVGGSGASTASSAPESSTETPQSASKADRDKAEESSSVSAAAIKETELEAVAAVDASIGFGDLFGSLSDSCYDEYGNARYCEPEFENAAFEKQVEVSSECGSPPSRFCTAYLNEHNDQIRNCHICDAQHPKKRHPAAHLTDMNNSNSPTCWVSAPISVVQSAANQTDNVTLILNLEKKYEITYVSMHFCSLKPDSLAIYKSADNGQSWQPYQFYSSQCRQFYGRHQRAALGAGKQGASNSEPLEARCANSSQTQAARHSGQMAFSTLEGRSGGQLAIERSQALQDWITATNIKIVLDRQQVGSPPALNLASGHHHGQVQPVMAAQQRQQQADQDNGSPRQQADKPATGDSPSDNENSLTSPSDTFNYAMSDLTVGGRCKCNGHASRCVHNKEGQLQCDCRHNTAGRDCEKCAPFHHDRPWQRASQLDANPCQPCNCNGHSRKCHFDAELYRLSGRRSGGVCTYCKDNTAGRHCHYCREGFTRDHSRPMSDKEACKHCDCHPIGSLGKVCNQTTGQCPCKEGVAGLQCNRCLAGYQQSSSLMEPCIKLPENDINSNPSLAADDDQPSGAGQDAEQQPPPSAVEEMRWRATPGDTLAQPSNRLEPGEFVSDNENPDKDDDSELADKDDLKPARKQLPVARYNRKQQQYTSAANFYRPLGGHRARHQLSAHNSAADDEESLLALPGDAQRVPQAQLDDDADYRYLAGQSMYKPVYSSHFYGKSRFGPNPNDYRHPSRSSLANRARSGELEPVANLEHADELNTLDEPARASAADGQLGYPPQNLGSNRPSIYADDTFNQIQTTPARHLQLGGATSGARGRHSAAGRTQHRFSGHGEQFAGKQQANSQLNAGELSSCGQCQSGTRRLGFRQFCHTHFAVKANVLSKFVADDWTRFELEIQDVFKSAPVAQVTAYTDNMVQSDLQEPAELSAQQILAGASLAANRTGGEPAPSDQPAAQHRLKVGTVHSIWVPTEDLACKCPRLKLRASYLLMGSIDAKENSANALQLDRHGVALEWRSSLQEKLIKYQRRQARGRC